MTLNTLAALADSDVGNLSRLERGVQGYSDSILQKLATALEVDVSDFFTGGVESQNDALITSKRESEPLTPRLKILIELFNELPDSEADELLKSLEEKKRHYDALYEELNKKRQDKAS